VDLLLSKVPSEYKPTFRREGVFHEVDALAAREITSSKSKDKDKESSEAASPVDSGNAPGPSPTSAASAATTIPGFKKLTSLSLDPEDAITLRARIIRFKHSAGDEEEEGDNAFEKLRSLVGRLASPDASEKVVTIALKELADLFASPHTSVSSFELLQSGIVDSLLQFTTGKERNGAPRRSCTVFPLLINPPVTVKKRREIFLDAFTTRRARGVTSASSPFSTLVKKLQESLTRMESFEVVTVAQGIDGQ
jgi:E3 ubiquitin-protein ligase TRIP12